MLLRKLSGSERNRPAKTGRRSGLLPDAFSLRLPKVAPRLVLPPTPSSPDDTLAGQTVLGWRPEDDHEAKRKLLEQESVEQVEGGLGIALEGHPHEVGQLPYTPANTPPPDSYVAEPKAAKASDQISFNHLIASGYALHPVLLNNYTVLEELGAGGYGVVVRAVREQDMQEVAIKIVWRNRMPKEAWLAVTGWEERLLTTPVIVTKEAHILRQISHPGVISYIDYFDDHNFLYLVRCFLEIVSKCANMLSLCLPPGYGTFWHALEPRDDVGCFRTARRTPKKDRDTHQHATSNTSDLCCTSCRPYTTGFVRSLRMSRGLRAITGGEVSIRVQAIGRYGLPPTS